MDGCKRLITFVGMLSMRTKLVFVLLTNYYQLFHAFLNEIMTLPGHPGHPSLPRSYKQGSKKVNPKAGTGNGN